MRIIIRKISVRVAFELISVLFHQKKVSEFGETD